MGLFGKLVEAAVDANEDAHASRLERGLESTRQALASLSDSVRAQALEEFLEQRKQLTGKIANWSRDGRIQVARKLQDEARRTFNFNQSQSYALWMAGAWLEGQSRGTERAKRVYSSLEELAALISTPSAALPAASLASQKSRGPEFVPSARSSEQPRGLDPIATKNEVENIFYPLLKVYLFEELFGKEGEAEMKAALVGRCTDWERRLLAAFLLGVWVGVVKRKPDADIDEKVAAASIASWFAIPMASAMAQIEDLRAGRARREVQECLGETARIVSRSEKLADMLGVVESIRGWSAAG